jgi:hypothetical protein
MAAVATWERVVKGEANGVDLLVGGITIALSIVVMGWLISGQRKKVAVRGGGG